MNKLRSILTYLVTGLTLLASPIKATSNGISQREIKPTLVTTSPTIDGRLEDVWNQAYVYTGFKRLSVPGKGEIESNPTSVRFLYDNEALYVGVETKKLEKIVASKTIDDDIGGDDIIKVFIDPKKSKNSVYLFGANLLDKRLDVHYLGDKSIDWDDVHWEVSSNITDEGYTMEFKIPWDIMKVPKNTNEFGINVIRNTPLTKNSENSALQYSELGEEDFSNYALLKLSSNVGKDRLTSHITPSLTQEVRGDNLTTSLGIDNLKLRYGKFSGYFTLNPSDDIIEADPHVSWNLTGDEINLPERRQFFKATGALFSMGREYFYSRRIGDLIFGGVEQYERPGLRIGTRNISAKQEGKRERYDIGRMIFEGKLLEDISNIGFFFVNSTDEDIDKIGVADWHVKKHQLRFDGEIARTSGEGSNQENHALWSQIKIAEPDVYETSLYVNSTGEKYNPQIGYQPIKGTKGARFVITRPNIKIAKIGEEEILFNPYIHIEENQYQSGKFFSNYYYLSLGLSKKEGIFGGRYMTARGKRDLENKIHSNRENMINLSYTPSTNLSFSGMIYFGKSYGYNFLNSSLNTSLGFREVGSINLGLARNSITNVKESKEDWVTTLQSSLNLGKNFTFSTNLRHTSLYEQLIANARLGYNPTPSTELYLWTTSQTDLNSNIADYQTNLQVNYTFDLAK